MLGPAPQGRDARRDLVRRRDDARGRNMPNAVIDALTPRQRTVLEFYLDTLPGAAGVQIHKAGWQGEMGGRLVPRREHAIVQILLPVSDGSTLHFYGTLGDATCAPAVTATCSWREPRQGPARAAGASHAMSLTTAPLPRPSPLGVATDPGSTPTTQPGVTVRR